MVEPQKPATGPKEQLPNGEAFGESAIFRIHEHVAGLHASAREALSFSSAERSRELARRRESYEEQPPELSRFGVDPNFLYQYVVDEIPLRRSDLCHSTGMQAVELSHDECETLQRLLFIDCHGKLQDVDLSTVPEGATVILFPEDFGDQEGKPSVGVVE